MQFCLITPIFAQSEEIEQTRFELYIQKQVERADLSGFIQATVENNTAHIKKLFENGLDPNGTIGAVPLVFYPIYLERPQVLELVLQNGADPNKTCFKISALLFSIQLKKKNCIELLLKFGADINKKCAKVTALDFAISKKDYETALYLLRQGALPSKYTYRKAKKSKNEELIKYLGLNVN